MTTTLRLRTSKLNYIALVLVCLSCLLFCFSQFALCILVNKNEPLDAASNISGLNISFEYDPTTFVASPHQTNQQQQQQIATTQKSRAARMMDLDALVGDFQVSLKFKRAKVL